MQIGQIYYKITTFEVTDIDEETNVVKGFNDVGAEIIMLEKDVDRLYSLTIPEDS